MTVKIVKTALLMGILSATTVAHAEKFTVTSKDIAPGSTIKNEQVFNGFGCSGKNISPELSWSHAPAGTKSFALLVHDPDAPTGGAGWWHWGVVNIPATAAGLAAGAGTEDGAALPAGSVQLTTDFGKPGWGGPCPPVGNKPHHYNFTLYALKVEKLDIPADAKMSLAGFMINANALANATFVGRYGR